MPNAFEAYELYLAVKAHFTRPTYDFHKFNGKVKTSVGAFERRTDQGIFRKIGRTHARSKLIDLYVANFVMDPDLWSGDFLEEVAEQNYTDWQKRVESLSYNFMEESDGLLNWLEQHDKKFNDLFRVCGQDHPIFLKMALQKVVSLETFIAYNHIFKFGKRFDQKLDDIIWRSFNFTALKYSSFINIDVVQCSKILRTKIDTEYPGVV